MTDVYVSVPLERAARQWNGNAAAMLDTLPARHDAASLLAWVRANGGEATYDPGREAYTYNDDELGTITEPAQPACIWVTASPTSKYRVLPNWWAICGDNWFHPDGTRCPHTAPKTRCCTAALRQHYSRDPDTLAQRWRRADNTTSDPEEPRP